MSEEKSVYVGIPGYVATGDPNEDSIADAIVESLEVSPDDVKVYEKNDKFYVFIKSLPFTFATANQTVAQAAELSQTYDHSVARLTKLVRRADKFQNELSSLKKEVSLLQNEHEKLKQELQEVQAQRQQQYELSKSVESDVQNLLDTFTS
ncbi:hypothetical protein TRFO_18983 [Tritrichomonas foetus]|uniref:Uncharacterized protein n=1 Tax=Tritrichomonas foetus TaxID=1144522 RepID=A0A1J4KJQ4_9EUKA|nr:hypothetical protein TRFO_18983 [Tritrichomonas foetus]|eukprot:OHT11535.1 hypothetical protein TRFO_18983 [Tritrichomonas foetus]